MPLTLMEAIFNPHSERAAIIPDWGGRDLIVRCSTARNRLAALSIGLVAFAGWSYSHRLKTLAFGGNQTVHALPAVQIRPLENASRAAHVPLAPSGCATSTRWSSSAAAATGWRRAYYLAHEHGIRDVAVLEQRYIGHGGTGRNTAIIRSNGSLPAICRANSTTTCSTPSAATSPWRTRRPRCAPSAGAPRSTSTSASTPRSSARSSSRIPFPRST